MQRSGSVAHHSLGEVDAVRLETPTSVFLSEHRFALRCGGRDGSPGGVDGRTERLALVDRERAEGLVGQRDWGLLAEQFDLGGLECIEIRARSELSLRGLLQSRKFVQSHPTILPDPKPPVGPVCTDLPTDRGDRRVADGRLRSTRPSMTWRRSTTRCDRPWEW